MCDSKPSLYPPLYPTHSLPPTLHHKMSFPKLSEIIPGRLYLGDKENAQNLNTLLQHNITHIVNVTPDVPCFYPQQFTYLQLPVDDNTEDLTNHLEQAREFIHSGQAVFVHCHVGASRSPTVVIYYLMKNCGWSYEHSLKHVRSKRFLAFPCAPFQLYLNSLDSKSEGRLLRSSLRDVKQLYAEWEAQRASRRLNEELK